MEKDLVRLAEKIDVLSEKIENPKTSKPSPNGHDLQELHTKIDYLTEQIEQQRRRQQAFDEFKDDMIPIANHLIKLSIDELAEIGNDFELEDLLFLLKRLLRNTHMLTDALDRIEGLMGLADEANILGKQVFSKTVETLDMMERQGYFAFARQGGYILERIVTEFSEEDVKALGDNIVTILTTVQNMTQPEILSIANNVVDAIRDDLPSKSPSVWQLLRELSDPRVRIGMIRMINLLKSLADQNTSKQSN